jgi:hypothetical protein
MPLELCPIPTSSDTPLVPSAHRSAHSRNCENILVTSAPEVRRSPACRTPCTPACPRPCPTFHLSLLSYIYPHNQPPLCLTPTAPPSLLPDRLEILLRVRAASLLPCHQERRLLRPRRHPRPSRVTRQGSAASPQHGPRRNLTRRRARATVGGSRVYSGGRAPWACAVGHLPRPAAEAQPEARTGHVAHHRGHGRGGGVPTQAGGRGGGRRNRAYAIRCYTRRGGRSCLSFLCFIGCRCRCVRGSPRGPARPPLLPVCACGGSRGGPPHCPATRMQLLVLPFDGGQGGAVPMDGRGRVFTGRLRLHTLGQTRGRCDSGGEGALPITRPLTTPPSSPFSTPRTSPPPFTRPPPGPPPLPTCTHAHPPNPLCPSRSMQPTPFPPPPRSTPAACPSGWSPTT